MHIASKKTILILIKLFAILFTAGHTLLLAMAWFLAYFNNDTTIIYINNYGEKYPELALWIVATPIVLIGLAFIVQDLYNEMWIRHRKRTLKVLNRVGEVKWL